MSRLTQRETLDVIQSMTDEALQSAIAAHKAEARRAAKHAAERQRWSALMGREARRRQKCAS